MGVPLADLLLDASPDALIALSADGTILFWNLSAAAMFGYRREDGLGRSLFDLTVPPDRLEEAERTLRDALAGASISYESVRRRKDGTRFHVDVSARALPDASGPHACVILGIKDVTEIRSLRESARIQARFGPLLEAAPDSMIVVNGDGRIILANTQTEQLFGYGREELVGKGVEILVPERFGARHPGHRAAYFEQPRIRAMGAGLELYGRRKDGHEFPVEISLSPLETEDGTLAMSAIRDISERKQAQRALEERTRALEVAQEALVRQERLAVLGQLAGGVSHELRNPLGVIKNAVYYLKMIVSGDERVQKHLAILEREVQTANRIVTSLLDYARVRPPDLVPVDLNDLLGEVLTRCPVGQAVVVVRRMAAGLTMAPVDREQVSLAIGNLVTNAIQAMPDGGTLTVETLPVAGGVQVVVTDTGAGILPEHLDKLFQPLFTTKAKGIGLGLALSRRLIEANGGNIAVTSVLGQGSRFTVTFTAR